MFCQGYNKKPLLPADEDGYDRTRHVLILISRIINIIINNIINININQPYCYLYELTILLPLLTNHTVTFINQSYCYL
jgi:hypothetical protein